MTDELKELSSNFERNSPREKLATFLEQAWKENPTINYIEFFSRMKRDNREQLIELIDGTSLIELMVQALDLLQSKDYLENDSLKRGQAAEQVFIDENIAKRVLLSNPHLDDQDEARKRKVVIKSEQKLAKQQGIPSMLIKLPSLRQIVEEARELRAEAAEIIQSQEYQEYLFHVGALPLDGSKDHLVELGQRMREIARLGTNTFGFETDFENNGPIDANPFLSF
ncbi:MAG: hypothetical protein U9O78_01340 [Patescibacteria group bacterium]|nr:hypothetical protein [Patescibacteria group bacterium]